MGGKVPQRRGTKWDDTPDDVFFIATNATRRLRRQMDGTDALLLGEELKKFLLYLPCSMFVKMW